MPYDPKAIANYFLDLAAAKNRPLTPMKLQKLIYYANGWCLAIKGQPLIDEQVEAWSYGPVIPSIYSEFAVYGNRTIKEHATNFISNTPGTGYVQETPSIDDDPSQAEFTKKLLDKVWDIYGDYTAIQLSNMTHAEGTPWHQIFKLYDGKMPKGTDIPTKSIQEHFEQLYHSGAQS